MNFIGAFVDQGLCFHTYRRRHLREALRRIGQRHGTTARTAPAPTPTFGAPIMDDLAAFLDASLVTMSGHSELAKAIR
jgi:hypothetical protein